MLFANGYKRSKKFTPYRPPLVYPIQPPIGGRALGALCTRSSQVPGSISNCMAREDEQAGNGNVASTPSEAVSRPVGAFKWPSPLAQAHCSHACRRPGNKPSKRILKARTTCLKTPNSSAECRLCNTQTPCGLALGCAFPSPPHGPGATSRASTNPLRLARPRAARWRSPVCTARSRTPRNVRIAECSARDCP